MANIPVNTKLWNMYVAQAKARFNKWPSATASSWVHRQYQQVGGKFAESVKDLSPSQQREHRISEKKKDIERRRSKRL